jgi:hypothetical protein
MQREHGVARCAVNVLLDDAVAEAAAIVEDEQDLRWRRSNLAALAQLIGAENRRLHRSPPQVPGVLVRAGAYAADRRAATVDWMAVYRALIEGADTRGEALDPAA